MIAELQEARRSIGEHDGPRPSRSEGRPLERDRVVDRRLAVLPLLKSLVARELLALRVGGLLLGDGRCRRH